MSYVVALSGGGGHHGGHHGGGHHGGGGSWGARSWGGGYAYPVYGGAVYYDPAGCDCPNGYVLMADGRCAATSATFGPPFVPPVCG